MNQYIHFVERPPVVGDYIRTHSTGKWHLITDVEHGERVLTPCGWLKYEVRERIRDDIPYYLTREPDKWMICSRCMKRTTGFAGRLENLMTLPEITEHEGNPNAVIAKLAANLRAYHQALDWVTLQLALGRNGTSRQCSKRWLGYRRVAERRGVEHVNARYEELAKGGD